MKKARKESDEPVFDYCRKKVLVIGAGNILFGDDGFGPAVIEELEKRKGLPKDVYFLDVGTSARGILFNMLLAERIPEALIIIDSMTSGKRPGTVLEVDLDGLGPEKSDDFQFHYAPTGNMLVELRDSRGMIVRIIACVVKDIPQEQMSMGLSEPVKAAVPGAADMALKMAGEILKPKKRK